MGLERRPAGAGEAPPRPTKFYVALRVQRFTGSVELKLPGSHTFAPTIEAGEGGPEWFLPAFETREAAKAWAPEAQIIVVEEDR